VVEQARIKIGDLICLNWWNELMLGYVVRVERAKNNNDILYHVRTFKEDRLFLLNGNKQGNTWNIAGDPFNLEI
jgi:hypothetical protein